MKTLLFHKLFFLIFFTSLRFPICYMLVTDAVKDYYGKVLSSSKDLKTSACTASSAPNALIRSIIGKIPEEINSKFYGCGKKFIAFTFKRLGWLFYSILWINWDQLVTINRCVLFFVLRNTNSDGYWRSEYIGSREWFWKGLLYRKCSCWFFRTRYWWVVINKAILTIKQNVFFLSPFKNCDLLHLFMILL